MIETTMAALEFVGSAGEGTALERIAHLLLEERGGDLNDLLIVVPGGRARRACLAALRDRAEVLNVVFLPPTICTPGSLEFELRPAAKRPSATAVDVLMAFKSAGLDEGLALQVARATNELAAAQVSWSDVTEAVAEFGGDPNRYVTFNKTATKVKELLHLNGLLDVDTARDEALQLDVDASLEVVLIGVVELSQRSQRALEGANVRAFVLAEDSLREGFDELGLIKPLWWNEYTLDVPLENVLFEDKPIDQAEAVVEFLASFEEVDVSRTAVVVADETLTDVLERELDAAGSPVHRGQGRPLSTLEPARLLQAIARVVEDKSVSSLRSLLGQPSIGTFLGSADGDPLKAIDRWRREKFSRSLEGNWIGDVEEEGLYRDVAEARRTLHAIVPRIESLLEPLYGAARTPSAWMPHVTSVLQAIYAESVADENLLQDAALEHLGRTAALVAALPDGLQTSQSAVEALRLLLLLAGSEAIRENSSNNSPQLELIGWLELPFDQADRVIIAGFNDEAIPGSGGVDVVLPESLRERLGLPTSKTRTARDKWVLSQAIARDASFTLSYRNSGGEPRTPSRLLLSGTGKDLADRVLSLTEPPSTRQHEPGVLSTSACFARPVPPPGPTVFESITVTGFREYLRCPYGFWLRHIRKLSAPDTKGRELDPRDFGNVVHHVVEKYIERNREEANSLSDPDAIYEVLCSLLEDELNKLVGSFKGVLIDLQADILRGRLRAFADLQATSVRDGWETKAVELPFKLALEIPGEDPIVVRGKVDRVDFHAQEGWRILDIKTSDKGLGPDQTHVSKRTMKWFDLQLPLYRQLLTEQLHKESDGEIKTGYLVLPKDNTQAAIKMGDTLYGLHAQAIEKAQDVVKAIRRGEFDLGSKPLYANDERALIYRAHSIVDGLEEA